MFTAAKNRFFRCSMLAMCLAYPAVASPDNPNHGQGPPPQTPSRADVDLNGSVDHFDLIKTYQSLGMKAPEAGRADVDRSGFVDVNDLTWILNEMRRQKQS